MLQERVEVVLKRVPWFRVLGSEVQVATARPSVCTR